MSNNIKRLLDKETAQVDGYIEMLSKNELSLAVQSIIERQGGTIPMLESLSEEAAEMEKEELSKQLGKVAEEMKEQRRSLFEELQRLEEE